MPQPDRRRADMSILESGADKPVQPCFRPPRMLFSAIDRPSVLAVIREGLARQVAKVHAPPGFGKTAALKACYEEICASPTGAAELFPGGVEHCGWLTLQRSYCDPVELCADLALALGVKRPYADVSLKTLLAHVCGRAGCTILFLDETDGPEAPEVTELLAELFLAAPDNLRIAAAFRRQTQLPLARLGVRGLVREVTAKDLAFTRTELRALFTRTLTTAEVDDFAGATEGWPALAQIARDLVPAVPLAEDRRAILEGLHPAFHAYVMEILGAFVSPSLRGVLRVCAILDDDFSPELAEHLSGVRMSTADIRLLDASSPLIERSDAGAGWYRLHPVLRKSLAAELAADPQSVEARLHSEAAHWFTERGLIEKAVSHAARGGNFSLAAQTIRQAGGVDLFIRAGHTVLEALIGDLPANVIHESPSLMLCHVLVLAKSGNVQAARERLDALKAAGVTDDPNSSNIDRFAFDHIDGLVDIYEDLRLDGDAVCRLEAIARDLQPQATWDLGWINNHLCVAYTRMGELDSARRCALKGLACYREEKTVYAEVFMLVHLGLVNTLAGNFSAALTFCREGLERARSAEWKDSNLEAICRVAAAEIHYQHGEIGLVEKTLSEAMEPIVRGEGWVEIFIRLFWGLARSRLRSGGLDMALAAIDRAEEVSVERLLPRLKVAADIMRLDVFARSGLIESAAALAERLSGAWQAMPQIGWTWREENDFHLACARLYIKQRRCAEAMAELDAVVVRSRGNGAGYYLLAAEVLATRIAWDDGRYNQSLEYLQAAIARARSHEVTQFFVDEGLEFAAILRAIVRRFGLKVFSADGVDFVNRVIGQRVLPGGALGKGQEGTSSCGQGLLSTREQEALFLLRKGKSNKEIARDLGLSEATVKFHMKNIFSKLGVSRRSMAVAVSQHLNLD